MALVSTRGVRRKKMMSTLLFLLWSPDWWLYESSAVVRVAWLLFPSSCSIASWFIDIWPLFLLQALKDAEIQAESNEAWKYSTPQIPRAAKYDWECNISLAEDRSTGLGGGNLFVMEGTCLGHGTTSTQLILLDLVGKYGCVWKWDIPPV